MLLLLYLRGLKLDTILVRIFQVVSVFFISVRTVSEAVQQLRPTGANSVH
jgi:hypothetical protein